MIFPPWSRPNAEKHRLMLYRLSCHHSRCPGLANPIKTVTNLPDKGSIPPHKAFSKARAGKLEARPPNRLQVT